MKFSVLDNVTVYNGFFRLSTIELTHEKFAGGQSDTLIRELIDRKHAAGILPYDPERDEIVLVEQFRIGAIEDAAGPWLIEVIAGYREPGEDSTALVEREAVEEADCMVSNLIPVHRYYSSPGGCNEEIQLYIGRTNTSGVGGIHGLAHEGEDIRVHVVPADTAFEWLDSGRINSAMPIIALQWFRMNREKIRQKWTRPEVD